MVPSLGNFKWNVQFCLLKGLFRFFFFSPATKTSKVFWDQGALMGICCNVPSEGDVCGEGMEIPGIGVSSAAHTSGMSTGRGQLQLCLWDVFGNNPRRWSPCSPPPPPAQSLCSGNGISPPVPRMGSALQNSLELLLPHGTSQPTLSTQTSGIPTAPVGLNQTQFGV